MDMFETSQPKGQKTYTSLANKYRPQTFEEVVGQESVSKTLMNALKTGRIAHAYLFYGPRGCGKTTSARLFAKALNCTGYSENKPTPHPCGKCPQCIEIAASADMDVLELDAASNTGVDKVREAIIDTVALASGRDRYKVFILDEVHMLSTSAFNALLKTIEEPPQHVVFILATTELHKVPLTISSRCQTFRFKPITEDEISSHLLDLAGAENIELDDEAARLIAASAGGALRDALTIFDRAIAFSDSKVGKDLVSEMLGLMPRDLVKAAVLAIVKNDGPALHKVFETLEAEGYDALSLLKDLKSAFGAIFYLSLNTGAEPFPGAKDILKEVSPGFIAGITRKISKLTDEVKFSDTPLLSAEVGLFTIMESSLDIEGFITRLEALEGGSVPQPAPAEKKTLNKPAQPVQQCSGDNWAAFKKELSQKYPFLYDILQDITPVFEADDKWLINFSATDAFLKDTLQKRVKDLEDAAQKTCGKKINFILSANAAPAPQKPKPAAAKPQKPAVSPISEEQPFVDGEYSAFLQDNPAPAAAAAQPKEIGETAKKILNMFNGQVAEPI